MIDALILRLKTVVVSIPAVGACFWQFPHCCPFMAGLISIQKQQPGDSAMEMIRALMLSLYALLHPTWEFPPHVGGLIGSVLFTLPS